MIGKKIRRRGDEERKNRRKGRIGIGREEGRRIRREEEEYSIRYNSIVYNSVYV